LRGPLEVARPAALLETLRQGSYDKGERTLKLATDTLRDGPRSALLGTLAIGAVVGL